MDAPWEVSDRRAVKGGRPRGFQGGYLVVWMRRFACLAHSRWIEIDLSSPGPIDSALTRLSCSDGSFCCGSVAFLFRVGLGEEKFDKLLAVVF